MDIYDVSIIIPIYNSCLWVEECLQSVVSQNLKNIQIICINDCSTDNSLDIIEKIARSDNRVVIINRSSNGGQAIGRNQGMLRAQGKYIYFLDSDDAIKGMNTLLELVSLSNEYNLDALMFDSEYVFANEQLREKFKPAKETLSKVESSKVITGRGLFKQIMNEKIVPCQPGRWFWKRSFLKDNNISFPTESAPHEDVYFYFAALFFANRVMYTNKKFHYRRYREGSVMTEKSWENTIRDFKSYFVVLDSCISILTSINSEDLNDEVYMKSVSEFVDSIESNVIHTYMGIRLADRKSVNFNNYRYKILYRYFLSHVGSRKYFLDEINLNNLRANKVVIYGAGECGVRVLSVLTSWKLGSDRICFVVSKKSKETPEQIKGINVYEFSEVKIHDGDIVIVAVKGEVQQEVIEILELNNIDYKILNWGYEIMGQI